MEQTDGTASTFTSLDRLLILYFWTPYELLVRWFQRQKNIQTFCYTWPLLIMIKAIILFSHSQLMLTLTKRLCAVLSQKKTSNNSSTSDKNSTKNCHVFSWATDQVYWKLLPLTALFLIW